MNDNRKNQSLEPWQRRIHVLIFEADTRAGKIFDLLLITSIVLSVIAVMLDSVTSVQAVYGDQLRAIEWFFTILFTVEYVFRLVSVGRPIKYATSFFGIVDLLAILPTFLSLILPGSQYLLVIRVLRVLRVFRVLKLVKYLGEADLLLQALRASLHKLAVFLFTVFILTIVLGSAMYLIEGEENGFTSIPRGIYWAIVTMTTVGYGDISPQTTCGQILAALVMILGYSIIAIPTGIATVEFSHAFGIGREVSAQACPQCSLEGHDTSAKFCKHCGSKL